MVELGSLHVEAGARLCKVLVPHLTRTEDLFQRADSGVAMQ